MAAFLRARSLVPPSIVAEVIRRLALRHALKQIARELNLSRNTVRAIDRGEHGREKTPIDRQAYEHCHGCGGKVLMPCQLCAVRAQIAA